MNKPDWALNNLRCFICHHHLIVTAMILNSSHKITVWFGLFLWHINHCWLFNAKSFLCIYIRYIRFGLVEFYGISTIVGYLMPNPFYAYILDI